MYDTYSLVQEGRRPTPRTSSSPSPSPDLAWASAEEAVAELATMTRRELVALFLRCAPPAPSELAYGDAAGCYDGRLLDNGPVLVRAPRGPWE